MNTSADTLQSNLVCPCDTGLLYNDCCGQYHSGIQPAPDALALMRSRYTAVALGTTIPKLADYLVQTIHRNSPYYDPNLKRHRVFWQQYSQTTHCQGLTIIQYELGETTAWVHFKAQLLQRDKPTQLEEKSQFVKLNKRWLYLNGEFINP
jgi:SEC-C motif domain protein